MYDGSSTNEPTTLVSKSVDGKVQDWPEINLWDRPLHSSRLLQVADDNDNDGVPYLVVQLFTPSDHKLTDKTFLYKCTSCRIKRLIGCCSSIERDPPTPA